MGEARASGRGEIAIRSRFCFLTGMSRQIFDRLVSQGMPLLEAPTGKGGRYQVSTAAAWQWLLARAEGRQDDAAERSLDSERSRLARLQADAQAMKNATMRGELLPADEVISGWQQAIGRARSLVLGVPPASAATIVLLARSRDAEEATTEVREHLTKLLDHALNELSTSWADSDDEEEGEAA